MEKWDLYNAKREKSGITMCRGEIIPKGLYHLSVSVWIVNQQGQYLLSQRHPKKQYPLYWECTGGSVLSGETSLQGAIREVKEELGILLTPGSEKLIYQTRRENVQDFYDDGNEVLLQLDIDSLHDKMDVCSVAVSPQFLGIVPDEGDD